MSTLSKMNAAVKLGSSSESLPDTSGCATAFLHKAKARCKAISQKTRAFAKKTKAFAKRAHVKRAREPQNEGQDETNAPHSKKVLDVAEASISVRPTVVLTRNTIHQVPEASVNVDPMAQSYERMPEQVPEEVGAENAMEVRGSIDVDSITPATQPECCEEEIRKDASPQNSVEMGGDFDEATTLGEHGHLRNEEGDGCADRSGMELDVSTTSYYEVTGTDDYLTAEDVEEILDYMPKDRNNSLWVKTDLLVSFDEVYGQWGDRYTLEMNNQEEKAQDFGGSPGESSTSEDRESYSAYERSLSVQRNHGEVAKEGQAVKEKAPAEEERMEDIEISFLEDSDVDSNSMVLVNDVRSAHAPERKSLVGGENSVLRVQGSEERRVTENEDINDTSWLGLRVLVVATVGGLLVVRWLYVYKLWVFY